MKNKKCEMRKRENNFVKWYIAVILTIILLSGLAYGIYKQGYEAGFKDGKAIFYLKYKNMEHGTKELVLLIDEIMLEYVKTCKVAKARKVDCYDMIKNVK